MNRAEIEIAVLQEAKNNLEKLLDSIFVDNQNTKYGILLSIIEIKIMIEQTEVTND